MSCGDCPNFQSGDDVGIIGECAISEETVYEDDPDCLYRELEEESEGKNDD